MIFQKDSMHYKNVLSKNATFYYKDLGKQLEAFLMEIKDMGVHPNGPVFYATNYISEEQQMNVEFFLPVREEAADRNEIKYHSYYSSEQMLSMRVTENFEEKTKEAYAAMISYLNAAKLKQTTPPFHILDRSGKQQFLTIKIGYLREE